MFNPVSGTIIAADLIVFTETADGVTFTLTAMNNSIGVTRFLTGSGSAMSNGLWFCGNGGSNPTDAGVEAISSGPALLRGGLTYDFLITGSAGAATQGFLTGFEFEKPSV